MINKSGQKQRPTGAVVPPTAQNRRNVKRNPQGVSISEALVARNEFYRENRHRTYTIALMAIVSAVISLFTTIYVATKEPPIKYFATDQSNRLIPLAPLNDPNHNDQTVVQWVTQALYETFTFGYTDWRMRLEKSTSEFFTATGKDAVLKALNSSGNLEAVIKKQLFLNLAVDDVPIIVNKGFFEDGSVYAWKIQTRGIITYRTFKESRSEYVDFDITVKRRSQLENAMGLGITQIIMSPRRREKPL